MDGTRFDEYYFRNCCGRPYARDPQWLAAFSRIADRIAADIGPRTVLDAGCAIGLLVEALRERGIHAEGIDVSEYAIGQVDASCRPYCRLASITSPLEARFDLIVCIEVLEHMAEADAERAIENICSHTDDVLFSSTATDYSEPTHLNVRPPEYWAERFARFGFLRDLDFDASFVTSWAARYVRRPNVPQPRLVREYERAFAAADRERRELRAQVLRWDRQILADAEDAARLREALAAVNRQLAQTQQQLAEARDRIAGMERSRFWRARTLWEAARHLLSRSPRSDK